MPVLKRINRLGDRAKCSFIKKCDRDLIDCISECAKNVLIGNVPLKRSQLSRLRRQKRDIRELSRKKTPLKNKRRILQKGGFLGALLTPVLSLLGGLLGGNAGRQETRSDRS